VLCGCRRAQIRDRISECRNGPRSLRRRRPRCSQRAVGDALSVSAWKGDTTVKAGQLAHLDRDPNNNAADNLCFLCLPHHDEYDSRTSQSKGLSGKEVELYRDRLHQALPAILHGGGSAKSVHGTSRSVSKIKGPVSTGNVSGSGSSGGVKIRTPDDVVIERSISTGDVSGSGRSGDISIGSADVGPLEECPHCRQVQRSLDSRCSACGRLIR
jgi:hypothetical protein